MPVSEPEAGGSCGESACPSNPLIFDIRAVAEFGSGMGVCLEERRETSPSQASGEPAGRQGFPFHPRLPTDEGTSLRARELAAPAFAGGDAFGLPESLAQKNDVQIARLILADAGAIHVVG